jgi:four helix bundle protein
MTTKDKKNFDLEDRTFRFTKAVIDFTTTLSRTIPNVEIISQVIRSAGSVGANYIEANEALSKNDFALRIKICRKEAKETIYWLRLMQIDNADTEKKRIVLINEASELMKIFGAIVVKTEFQPDK